MFRWTCGLCVAAIAFTLSGPVQADDYNVVRWRSGDCQIWNNDTNRMPWGDGWILLAWNMPNYDTALNALKNEVAKGNCRW